MKPVDILVGIDRHKHALRVDLRRERKLHENAVDPLVAVEPLDQPDDRRLRCIRRQAMLERREPDAAQARALLRT